jgi:hypothetical protein
MHVILITLVIVVVVVLIHISYVDFRFRYRDGLTWFWMLNPAPPLMWVARASIVGAVLVALLAPLIG